MNLEWNWCHLKLMNLEWNWCPPLADEPGVELVPTFSLMNQARAARRRMVRALE
jgi:hypothetical protein